MGSTITDRANFMARYSAFSPYRLIQRETGFPTPVGASDAMARSLYCGMRPIASWDYEQANSLPTGGVFNLEFSPEGSLLVAACEKKSIQIFDPLTHQRIHTVNGAHSDCVNCVKFLDGRMFATCSDDTTIALWDVRNLKKKIRSLLGHSNWVKNIEFSVKDKLLVTSGLDGSIYTWDINSYTEFNLVYQRVFHASGLMRCRLSPDARQMVMCTTGGLLVIVHDLNLTTLAQDLHGFKPNLYRLMQMSQQLIPIAAMYDHLFDDKRRENRVEFVSDFPDGNDAQVVSALQIHPQGWSALSRNISHDDRSEWSCIHDIQANEALPQKAVRDTARPPPPAPRRPGPRPALRRPRPRPRGPRPMVTVPPAGEPRSFGEALRNIHNEEPGLEVHPNTPRPEGAPGPSGAGARLERGISSIQNDVWEASITIKQRRTLQDMYSRGQVGRNFNMQRIMGINTGIAPPAAMRSHPGRVPPPDEPARPVPPARARDDPTRPVQVARALRRDAAARAFHAVHVPPRDDSPRASSSAPAGAAASPTPSPSSVPSSSGGEPSPGGGGGGGAGGGGGGTPTPGDEEEATHHYIRQNRDRLLYYIEETNEGKGFIKELCYSADGRLVCSPFGRGMRLLALDERCAELSQCARHLRAPAPMLDVGQSLGVHQDLVVSSKFSPRHHLLVTGCLEGRIVWYEPYSGESLY